MSHVSFSHKCALPSNNAKKISTCPMMRCRSTIRDYHYIGLVLYFKTGRHLHNWKLVYFIGFVAALHRIYKPLMLYGCSTAQYYQLATLEWSKQGKLYREALMQNANAATLHQVHRVQSAMNHAMN